MFLTWRYVLPSAPWIDCAIRLSRFQLHDGAGAGASRYFSRPRSGFSDYVCRFTHHSTEKSAQGYFALPDRGPRWPRRAMRRVRPSNDLLLLLPQSPLPEVRERQQGSIAPAARPRTPPPSTLSSTLHSTSVPPSTGP